MNNCCSHHSILNSNSRIYEGYFSDKVKKAERLRRTVGTVLAFFLILYRILTGARVRSLVRGGCVALCLVGLTGVIGAVELGRIGLSSGLAIGAFLTCLEFLLLRRHGS